MLCFRIHNAATDSIASASQAQRARKAAKAGNTHGDPIELKSKLLAAVVDPKNPQSSVFVAESAGSVRRIKLGVCNIIVFSSLNCPLDF